MPGTLLDLGGDVLGAIVDFVDAYALVRLILCGQSMLNGKVYRSARSFVLEYSSHASRKFWPKILSHFSALERVRICALFGSSLVPLFGVDIMVLPATLRSLDLVFENSVLALVELPPTNSQGLSFRPRLRPEVRAMFSNLVTLNFQSEKLCFDEWDYSRLLEDLCAWPIVLSHWPTFLQLCSLDVASKLPSSTLALEIDCGIGQADEDMSTRSLPSSLTQLVLYSYRPYYGPVFEIVPSGVVYLSVELSEMLKPKRVNFEILSRLTHLTHLGFSVETCTKELLRAIPTSVVHLNLIVDHMELDSLAHFHPGLTYLSVSWNDLICTRSGRKWAGIMAYEDEEHEELGDFGLPDEIWPSMREDMIFKLPPGLTSVSENFFAIVRPNDWDVFPRGVTNWIASSPHFLFVESDHLPFLSALPPGFKHLDLSSLSNEELAGAVIETLPARLNSLTMSFLAPTSLLKPADPPLGSMEEKNALSRQWRSVLQALSRRLPHLPSLQLEIDDTFELDLLASYTGTLESLNLSGSDRADSLTWLKDRRRAAESDHLMDASAPESPPIALKCLTSLKILDMNDIAQFIIRPSLPQLFANCPSLTSFQSDFPDPPDAEHLEDDDLNDFTFPTELVAQLPQGLRHLTVRFQHMDANTFTLLPRSLESIFCARTRREACKWKFQDVVGLPKGLRSGHFPFPQNETATIEIARVSDHFDSPVNLGFVGPFTISYQRRIPVEMRFGSWRQMLADERTTRSTSSHCLEYLGRKAEINGDEDAIQGRSGQDSLPEPSKRSKRKRDET